MMIFAYPFTTMTTQLYIKDPDFNDSETVTLGTKFSVMMNGSIRSRRLTPAPTKFSFQFSELSRSKTLEVQDFLMLCAGDYVRMIDMNGIQWKGKIIEEPIQTTTTGRGHGNLEVRKEANTISIEFEGVKV